jgi:hypothetical protein
MIPRRLGCSVLGLAVVGAMAAPRLARADEPPASDPLVRAFVQPGVGLVELGNIKAGAFLGSHLSIEAMAAWNGTFGARWGGGFTTFIGSAEGHRPPRHALTLGARLMLDGAMTFDAHGDDLSSYVALPVGYSYVRDDGLFFTATAAPVVLRDRTSPTPTTTGHEWAAGGPLFNVGVGFVFPAPGRRAGSETEPHGFGR